MQAISEKLEKQWKENSIAIPELRHCPNRTAGKPRGRLTEQDWKRAGAKFELCCLLCVVDGAFNSTNRDE
jgi:hypothetical protein